MITFFLGIIQGMSATTEPLATTKKVPKNPYAAEYLWKASQKKKKLYLKDLRRFYFLCEYILFLSKLQKIWQELH